MERRPKPWFRKGRGWFVTIDGRQVPLGPEKEAAYRRFHELMAEPKRPTNLQHPLVSQVLDEFLEWTKNNRAPATYETCRTRLQSLLDSLPPNLTVQQLKPFHIQHWLDAHPNWSSTSGRSNVATAQRAFNWAMKMGHISSSPVAYFEKPPAESRDRIVTSQEFEQILSHVRDDEFTDLLNLHWETGCRPQESLYVEARFVDLKNSRWVFPIKKSKGKRKPRIVYLNHAAMSLTRRHMEKWPDGPIFRNTQGRPWNKDSISCRFRQIKAKTGTRYCLYLFRHTFATRMLEAGLDALSVALLLGHSNAAQLSTTYQHLNHNPGHLLDQLRKASK